MERYAGGCERTTRSRSQADEVASAKIADVVIHFVSFFSGQSRKLWLRGGKDVNYRGAVNGTGNVR